MTVKINLATCEIANRLLADEHACWSRSGAYGLADYLQELSYDIGEDIEFDLVAIRCEYSEYTWESLYESYECEFNWGEYDADFHDDYLRDLRDSTAVAWYDDDTIIICDF